MALNIICLILWIWTFKSDLFIDCDKDVYRGEKMDALADKAKGLAMVGSTFGRKVRILQYFSGWKPDLSNSVTTL